MAALVVNSGTDSKLTNPQHGKAELQPQPADQGGAAFINRSQPDFRGTDKLRFTGILDASSGGHLVGMTWQIDITITVK